MRTVDDFRAWARRQWRRHGRGWLVEPETMLGWPLHPPTEAEASADPEGVARELRRWRELQIDGVSVEWVERRWRHWGKQSLPARATVTPEGVAGAAMVPMQWCRGRAAVERIRRAWPIVDFDEVVRVRGLQFMALSEGDIGRVLSLVEWRVAHPETELFEREYPVEGVDTKFHERHRGILDALVDVVRHGPRAPRSISHRWRRFPEEPDGGSHDAAWLAMQDWTPGRVLIVENLVSLEGLPPLSDAVAVHGMGFAVGTLADIPWIRDRDVYYWGDVDTFGFRILGLLRQRLPAARSLLMDPETLTAHRRLAGREPSPFVGEIGFLTAAERATLAEVRAGQLRLEQERIPRDVVRSALALAGLRD